jgi:RNA polymerase sigma-70 factor, ECF subfamily
MPVEQEVLVRRLLAERAMLLGYIASIVRDPHGVEDVFQDVALIVLKKRDELDDPSGFPAWARKVARLEALNAVRRRAKAPRPLDESVQDALDLRWNAGDGGGSADALRTCLDRLSPRARLVVELRYRDDLSGQGLADRLAQPLNTVYVTLSRIHRALSDCLRGRLRHA